MIRPNPFFGPALFWSLVPGLIRALWAPWTTPLPPGIYPPRHEPEPASDWQPPERKGGEVVQFRRNGGV